MAADQPYERRQKYVSGLLIRVIVCIVFGTVFAINCYLASSDPARLQFAYGIALLVILCALNWPFWLLGKARHFPLTDFYVHWAIDLMGVTILLHLLGGVDLPYGSVGYMIMILTSAVFLSQGASFAIATASAVCFDMLVLAEANGISRHYVGIWQHHYTNAVQVFIIVASNVFFFLFAYLAGSLAQQLKTANAALSRTRDELEVYSRRLEDRVRDRTAALERRNTEIEEFVHIVTHDLRNVSVGASEVARRLIGSEGGTLSARGRRYASHLLEDTRNMNVMLSNLLALFRVDNDRGRLEPVDLSSLVGEVVKAKEQQIAEKGINIIVGDLPRVMAPPVQMRHVIANLLGNAIKYTGDKPAPEIIVDCREEPSAFTVCVADNGIGISPGQHERIFNLYHRGPDQNVAGVYQEGEGVGLAITKRIVERWGGTIWVASELHRGSRFYFRWPKGEAIAGETDLAR